MCHQLESLSKKSILYNLSLEPSFTVQHNRAERGAELSYQARKNYGKKCLIKIPGPNCYIYLTCYYLYFQIYRVKSEFLSFLTEVVSKLFEKSPIAYSLARILICLDPKRNVFSSFAVLRGN